LAVIDIYVSVSGSRTDSSGLRYYDGVGDGFLISVIGTVTSGSSGYQASEFTSNLPTTNSMVVLTLGALDDVLTTDPTLHPFTFTVRNLSSQTINRGGGYSDTYGPTSFTVSGSVYIVASGSGTDFRYPATGSIVIQAGVTMTPISFTASKATFYAASDTYENTLSVFNNRLTYAEAIYLPHPYSYNPGRVSQITTRLLELRESTIAPGLRFAAMSTNRAVQLSLLRRIDDIISSYRSLYPTIIIDDGEGIPYQ